MSLRGHSVVVDPALWAGELDDLAKRLVPIVGQPSRQLVDRLASGPMTLETDLTLQSAEALQTRLEALGVVANIESEGGDIAFGFDEMDLDLDAVFSDLENLPGDSTATLSEASEPANPRTTQMGFATQVADSFNEPSNKASKEPTGWGDIFPDLKHGEPSPTPRKPISPFGASTGAPEAKSFSRSDLKKKLAASASISTATPPTAPPSLDELEGKALPKVELARIQPVKIERPKIDPQTPSADAWASLDIPKEPEIAPTAPTPPPPVTAAKPTHSPEQPSMTAAAFMEQIVGSKEEMGPYVPAGFDDGYEHAPAVATALSVVAPGAGHVYNGEDERAFKIALMSFLIKPWIDAVRESRVHAEKIKTYHKPRPESGSFRRAIFHVFGFWFALAFIGIAAYFLLSTYVFHESEAEALRKIGTVDIRNAHANARTKVLEARLNGLSAVREEIQKDVKPVFTMTEAERVRRLYSVGVERCRENEYQACTAIMKKVVKLDPLYRQALALQTWASAQINAKTRKPMPDVGAVPTLTELEKSELVDEVDLP